MVTKKTNSTTAVPPATQPAAPTVTGNPAIDTAIQDVTNGMGAVSGLVNSSLTPADKKHTARVKPHGLQYMGPMIDLANRKPQLVPVGVDPVALANDLQTYQQLVALLAIVSKGHTDLSNTVFQKRADLYKATLAIYAIASQSTGNDAEIAYLVGEMKKSLSTGPRVQKYHRVAGPKPAPAAASTPAAPAGGSPASNPTANAGSGTAPASGASNPTANTGSGTGPVSTGSSTGNGSSAPVPVYYPNGNGQPHS